LGAVVWAQIEIAKTKRTRLTAKAMRFIEPLLFKYRKENKRVLIGHMEIWDLSPPS
jgi:hypothetical protein